MQPKDVKITQEYIQKTDMVLFLLYIGPQQTKSPKKSLFYDCPRLLLLVSSTFFLGAVFSAFLGFSNSSSFSRCQQTQDQQLTANIAEPLKLSKKCWAKIDYTSKKQDRSKAIRFCST